VGAIARFNRSSRGVVSFINEAYFSDLSGFSIPTFINPVGPLSNSRYSQ
jgi:hypothetical protein